jgi:hypothetical protein
VSDELEPQKLVLVSSVSEHGRPDMGKLAAGWTYKDQADEMRGKTTRFATVRAQGLGTAAPELYIYRSDAGPPDRHQRLRRRRDSSRNELLRARERQVR